MPPRTKKIDAYEHTGKEHLNNAPAGSVTPDTDPDLPHKTNSFDVPTLSLHVHE